MFRKSIIAIAAAATMVLSMGAMAPSAEAGIKVYIGGPGYYYRRHHGYVHRHCKWVRVWKYGHYVKVRRCWRHRHY